MQLSLQLSENPMPADVTWEAMSPAERLAAVAALARLMAKSIGDEERHDD